MVVLERSDEGVDAGGGADVELFEGEADGAALGVENLGFEELGVGVEGFEGGLAARGVAGS